MSAEQPTTRRAQVFRAIMAGIDRGLPAPKVVRFSDLVLTVDLDSVADLHLWADHFGLDPAEPWYHHGQPFPDLANPANSHLWSLNAWRPWNYWHLTLHANDPITDEQRQQWIDSGQAARHQADRGEQA
jgi:hypothetical protein